MTQLLTAIGFDLSTPWGIFWICTAWTFLTVTAIGADRYGGGLHGPHGRGLLHVQRDELVAAALGDRGGGRRYCRNGNGHRLDLHIDPGAAATLNELL